MKNCNKRVLFIIASFNSGGLENYLLRYIKYDNNIIPYVLAKRGIGGSLESSYIEHIGNDNIIKYKVSYFSPVSWYKLYNIIKKHNIDVVCDFSGDFSGITLWIAKLLKIDTRIALYRGSINRFQENILTITYAKIVRAMTLHYATKVLSNSYAAFNFFFPNRNKENDKFRVIYNGISSDFIRRSYSKNKVRAELGIPDTAFLVGHTGRVHFIKNHETIMKTAELVCSQNDNIHFVLAGKDTETLLVSDEFKDRIHCIGYCSDVCRLLNAFDLFYFPSVSEGQPNSLIEAMVKNLPIVASNIAPIQESVPDNFKQYLIDPIDYKAAAELIIRAECNSDFIESIKLGDWAIAHYNADTLFGEFKSEIFNKNKL